MRRTWARFAGSDAALEGFDAEQENRRKSFLIQQICQKMGSFGKMDTERFSTQLSRSAWTASDFGFVSRDRRGFRGVRARDEKPPQVVSQSSDLPQNWVRSAESTVAFFHAPDAPPVGFLRESSRDRLRTTQIPPCSPGRVILPRIMTLRFATWGRVPRRPSSFQGTRGGEIATEIIAARGRGDHRSAPIPATRRCWNRVEHSSAELSPIYLFEL